MLFTKKGEREISQHSKNDIRDLKIRVHIEVEAKHEYHTDEVVDVKIEKTLQCNSDSSLRDVLNEVDDILNQVVNESEDTIRKSHHLSDGYHAKKKSDELV